MAKKKRSVKTGSLYLGLMQIIGALLVFYFGRAMFLNPTGERIALGVLAFLWLMVGLHHTAGALSE